MTPAPAPTPYAEARELIRDGDVLLFKARGPVAAVIRWGTRSEFSHAALAVWMRLGGTGERDRLMLVESRERRGCRMIPLSSAVKSGARISWFAPREGDGRIDRRPIVAAAIDRLGAPYGWWSIVRDAFGRLPLLSLVWRRRQYSTDDLEDPGVRVKCSTLVALAWRAAGVDLVPNLADRSTDPGDLARSAELVGLGEIVP